MALADDGRVIRVARDARVQLLHRRLIGLGKLLLLAARQQHIVGSDAGLPGIDQLAVGHLERSGLHIAVLRNDAGRLAPELQRGGRQVHGCRLRHTPPHGRGAGEQQMVELQTRELRGHGHVPLDHAELFGCKELGDQFTHFCRGMRRQLAGLEHHAIARRQRRDGRRQR